LSDSITESVAFGTADCWCCRQRSTVTAEAFGLAQLCSVREYVLVPAQEYTPLPARIYPGLNRATFRLRVASFEVTLLAAA